MSTGNSSQNESWESEISESVAYLVSVYASVRRLRTLGFGAELEGVAVDLASQSIWTALVALDECGMTALEGTRPGWTSPEQRRASRVPPNPLLRLGVDVLKSDLQELGEIRLNGTSHFGAGPLLNLDGPKLWHSTGELMVDSVTVMVAVESPFSGREGQMAILREQLDRASSGVGSVILVEADAGMGKSRLLEEVMRAARTRHFRVGTCAADPGDGMVEMSTLMVALLDGPEPILDRAALPASHALPEQRYWLLQDLQGLLERAAVETPLLICLDDLQWTDAGTAAALRALPNHLATVPIVWVLAFRPSFRSSPFGTILDHLDQTRVEQILLGPLGDEAVREITARVLHSEPSLDVLTMVQRAGGSPFVLAEMLWGLTEEQLVRIESGQAELVEARLPGPCWGTT